MDVTLLIALHCGNKVEYKPFHPKNVPLSFLGLTESRVDLPGAETHWHDKSPARHYPATSVLLPLSFGSCYFHLAIPPFSSSTHKKVYQCFKAQVKPHQNKIISIPFSKARPSETPSDSSLVVLPYGLISVS